MTSAEERELLNNTRLLLGYLRPHHVVAHALLPLLDDFEFTTSEVIERAINLDPILYAVLDSHLGFDETINTRLGKLLSAIEGSPVAGRKIRKVKIEHGSALWACEKVGEKIDPVSG